MELFHWHGEGEGQWIVASGQWAVERRGERQGPGARGEGSGARGQGNGGELQGAVGRVCGVGVVGGVRARAPTRGAPTGGRGAAEAQPGLTILLPLAYIPDLSPIDSLWRWVRKEATCLWPKSERNPEYERLLQSDKTHISSYQLEWLDPADTTRCDTGSNIHFPLVFCHSLIIISLQAEFALVRYGKGCRNEIHI